MPDPTIPTPREQLHNWFQWLLSMQVACESASQVPGTQNVAQFASTTISTLLTDDTQTGEFLTALKGKTPYTFDAPLVAQSTTFESLLEKASSGAPAELFANFLVESAGAPYDSMSFSDFSGVALATLFPSGAATPLWSDFQNGVTSSVPSCCYSATQQAAVAKLLTAAGGTVGTLLNQLVNFG